MLKPIGTFPAQRLFHKGQLQVFSQPHPEQGSLVYEMPITREDVFIPSFPGKGPDASSNKHRKADA